MYINQKRAVREIAATMLRICYFFPLSLEPRLYRTHLQVDSNIRANRTPNLVRGSKFWRRSGTRGIADRAQGIDANLKRLANPFPGQRSYSSRRAANKTQKTLCAKISGTLLCQISVERPGASGERARRTAAVATPTQKITTRSKRAHTASSFRLTALLTDGNELGRSCLF